MFWGQQLVLGPCGASSRPHFQEAGAALSIPCLGTALSLGHLQGHLPKNLHGDAGRAGTGAAPAGPAAPLCGCTRGGPGHFCPSVRPISGRAAGEPRCPALAGEGVWAQVCAAPLRHGRVGAGALSADYRAGQLLPQESHPSQHSCLGSASPTRGSAGQQRWHSAASPPSRCTIWGPG